MGEDTQDVEPQGAFLPIYLIAIIILTASSNVILLVTFHKVAAIKVYAFEKALCLIGLVACAVVQGVMLVALAIQGSLHNHIFCEISGIFIALMQRAAIFNICALNVERYYNVVCPMNPTMRQFGRVASLVLFVLAFTLSMVPTFFHLANRNDVAYQQLNGLPLCLPYYPSDLKPYLYFDLVASFLLPSTIILLVGCGMSKEICKLSSSRVRPFRLRKSSVKLRSAVELTNREDVGMQKPVSKSITVRMSSSFRKQVGKRRKKIPKAFVILPLTFLLVVILNLPTVLVMLSAKYSEESWSFTAHSNFLEYMCCIGIINTYLVYPVLNGLTNRVIRNNAIRILRNRINTYYIESECRERSSVSEEQNGKGKQATSIKTVCSQKKLRFKLMEIEEISVETERRQASCNQENVFKSNENVSTLIKSTILKCSRQQISIETTVDEFEESPHRTPPIGIHNKTNNTPTNTNSFNDFPRDESIESFPLPGQALERTKNTI